MKITLKLSETAPELNFENRTAHTLAAAFSDGITEEFLDVSPEACYNQFVDHLKVNRTYILSGLAGEVEAETVSAKDDPDILSETAPEAHDG